MKRDDDNSQHDQGGMDHDDTDMTDDSQSDEDTAPKTSKNVFIANLIASFNTNVVEPAETHPPMTKIKEEKHAI